MNKPLYPLFVALVWVSGLVWHGSATGQDLYDPTVLRSFALTFDDADWKQRLRDNYSTETPILADLVVDGTTYFDVGVRIRGNTSYNGLPAGSEKFSLRIEIDFTDPEQSLMGYESINLNNGFRDPTFMREVTYNNYVAQFIPNPRASHALLTLNGESWGVYINVQQPNKDMLRDYFVDEDGARFGCSNFPSGPGLAYNGPNASGYTMYQVLDDGGLANPLAALIEVTRRLSTDPLASLPAVDEIFAIDPSIWSVVLENFLTDDDSYINKGCDFITYIDPVDDRMHLLQRDANETFTGTLWAPTRNFNASNKPVLSRILAVPEFRQRYFAHYRTVLRDLDMAYFGPIFDAQRARIEAAVQADTKRIYSYTLFQNNFVSTVNMPFPGIAGGNVPGLQQFVDERADLLAAVPELAASGPSITGARSSSILPDVDDIVHVTADVAAAGNPIAGVELFFRPRADQVYQRVAMLDDGASGDGSAGDGVYGVALPIDAVGGQRVDWYVAARADDAFGSLVFLPELAERGPETIRYAARSDARVRITEWMYDGDSGEFVEITNVGRVAIDLTGWSIDDDKAQPGVFALTGLGMIVPGQSVIVTDVAAEAFRSAWGLDASVGVIGLLGDPIGNNFGRNDQIHIFDADGALVDRLQYGDQVFTGSIRTQDRSGWAPCAALGANDVTQWQHATVGDEAGSQVAAGSADVGNPGRSLPACVELVFTDGFE